MAASMVCRGGLRKFKQLASIQYTQCRGNREATNSMSRGYFVFIPEIPKDTKVTNPIMDYDKFPQFSKMNKDSVVRGCAKLALLFDVEYDKLVQTLGSKKLSFEEIIDQMERSMAPMQYGMHQAEILTQNSYKDFPRSFFNRTESQVQRSLNEIFFHEEFYKALKRIDKENKLTPYQRRLLDMYFYEAKLIGLHIFDNKKDYTYILECYEKIERNQQEFEMKVMSHKRLFFLDINQSDWKWVEQLPPAVRQEIARDKSAPDVGPWRVTLKKPVVEAFLEVCPNRKLRFKVWNGWHIIGTHFSTDIRLHTFEIPGQITEARRDIALKLGYEHYTDMCMERRMAGNVKTVYTMLDTYREHFYPMAKKEMEDLQQFANSSGFPEAIRQWDITFFRRQHCDKLYNMHKVDRKPYFSVPLVLETMFSVCERMFSIKIEPVLQPDVWNSDVMAFDVHNLDGAFVGRFYLDLYARPTKRMADTTYLCRERCDRLGMTPISVITLNLNKSEMSGIPSLMSFQDVLTLFGEFGNTLQQVLSEVPLLELSSQRNIDRDAIFVCANVMKMIAQQPSIVRDMSQHHLSGESLDDHDIDKLLKCQLHMKGFDMCHQLYKSAFDIENHLAHDNYWKDIQMDMYKLFMPLEIHKEDWIWCSDPTLWMSDAFAAAYYLHIWSEMLAANIMEEFTVSGFDNEKQLAKVGMRFRETYLAVGGAESAKSVFQKFTGRNPSLESLLKRYPR
ncbi:uncharacterized protein LOC128245796 [Mya arenaria]|uniref:uncharacterized protein LOC128245796 n=1 Tax=Mya arenaria TaxID=6604 RepID=UPI0022E75119|nr:uncharacterized protein LOC128245796 [Mya arenaria]